MSKLLSALIAAVFAAVSFSAVAADAAPAKAATPAVAATPAAPAKAEAKKEEARFNALAKRGEVSNKHTDMTVCGCGAEGCIICSYSEPRYTTQKKTKKEIKVLSIDELRELLKEDKTNGTI